MKSPCLMAAAAMMAFSISSGAARAADPLAAARLRILGSRLTVYADAGAGDADQLVATGEQARVRTCYGALDAPCGSVAAGDSRVAGLEVVADLSGPELARSLELRTPPGGTFVLPSFQQPGDYRLANIRLVNASGSVLGWCEPPVAVLHVDQVLLTSATVTRMNLADLQRRGIHLSQDSYQAFDFKVGFAFRGESVTISLPVVYQGGREATPLAEPEVDLDALPDTVAPLVERWQPPTIVPFVLEPSTCDPEREERCNEQEVENHPPDFPLFGAIVIPGTVSFLHQFFDAQLIVANGAEVGSNADLTNLEAMLKLPAGGVLRLARTDPPVAPGQPVPLVGDLGAQVILPTKQATASWSVEGLKAGTHALTWDLSGDLVREGKPPLTLASRAQGLVEVVDARFHLSFSHPDVVREGETYSLLITVTNLSTASQEGITLTLDEGHLEGTSKADPGDDLARHIPTLGPGGSETLEFALISLQTGKCYATTLEADSGIAGSIHLRTGVGELGIPLSPATLVLPRHTERLGSAYGGSDEMLRANLRLLGLAYSLATAPAGMAPAGLPALTTPVVERRAWDLAEAGRRTLLHDGLLESLEVLTLDQLGNRHPLTGFDELRRESQKGAAAADALAGLLRQQQAVRDLDAVELLDHLAATTSYAAPFLAAVLAPVVGEATPELSVRRITDSQTLCLGMTACGVLGGRSLPFGEAYAVSVAPGGSETAPLAVVGHVAAEEVFHVYLHNATEQAARGRLVLLVPEDESGRLRRLDFGEVEVPPFATIGVIAGASVPDPGEGFRWFWPASSANVEGTPSPSLQLVALPPFAIVGAVQDFRISAYDLHGSAVAYLFNRPPRQDIGLLASAFSVSSTFDGLDVHGQPVRRETTKSGEAAFLQDDSRVLIVRYSGPISPFRADDGSPLVEHEQVIAPQVVMDRFGNTLAGARPVIETESEPLHVGGLVTGRVIRGNGEAAAGATVELLRVQRYSGAFGGAAIDVVERVVTDGAGEFYFDCIEAPHWRATVEDSFTLRATVPAGADPVTEPAVVGEVTSVIRQQGRLATINIALLGRGTVTGRLLYADDHAPVTDGTVVASSTLFREMKNVAVGTDGSFTVPGVPVGPVTLTGRDSDMNVVYATVGIAAPGAVVDVLLELPRAAQPPGTGTVLGTIVRRSGGAGGDEIPAAGATVSVYSSGYPIATAEADGAGRFRFDDVPAGQVTVQAADWRISRSAVLVDVLLGEGETRTLSLALRESVPRVVVGAVYYHDPVLAALVPVAGAPVFIPGPGVVTRTAADGSYRLEGVPIQGMTDTRYEVTAIDFDRQLQGSVPLQVLDASPAEVFAPPIVLEPQFGGLEGIVLDPLGRPYDGARVVLFPIAITSSSGGGKFSINAVPIGAIGVSGEPRLLAHVGDGMQEGKVGYFGSAATQVVYGGHRPFVTVRMLGSGVVRIRTTNQAGDDIQSLVYVRPTAYVEAEKTVRARPELITVEPDDDNVYQIEIPVGWFQAIAYHPFHGTRTFNGEIKYPGQVLEYDVTFEQTGTINGTVLDVDGVTPVPRASVTLLTETFTPRAVQADDLGRYTFDLVPPGRVMLTATAAPGGVERVGASLGAITVPGQVLDLPVRLKAKGTVSGRVVQQTANGLEPVAYAHVAVQEHSYPNRRLPAAGSFVLAGPDGRYQVSGVVAGPVGVVARDPAQVERTGSTSGAISADWQVVELPDIVLSTDAGTLAITVRRGDTANAVPDCQVTLASGEATVTDATGVAVFEALPLGTHSVYAFHAPSGRGGRLGGLLLTNAGQHLAATVTLNQTGVVRGALFDDAARTAPVPGATVELRGTTTVGELRALATTEGTAGDAGGFRFEGIPEGRFSLTAAAPESPRRAATDVELTALSPIADVALVLEATGDVFAQVRERLSTSPPPGHVEVDTDAVSLSVTLEQDGYRFTEIQAVGTPSGHGFAFPSVLLARRMTITAREVDGEQRSGRIEIGPGGGPGPSGGHGTSTDPYWLVLGPKGTVRVTVRDAQGALVPGATVALTSPDGRSVSALTGVAGNALGIAVFGAVTAGTVTASASLPGTTLGGIATGSLEYDDDLVDLAVSFAPTVAVSGSVRQPAPGDAYVGDGSDLPPQASAAVEITDGAGVRQTAVTAEDGTYRFVGVAPGPCVVKAWQPGGDATGQITAQVVGPDGNENVLGALVLDAAPPRIVSITPPPGMERVSRSASVVIVFSERLHEAVLSQLGAPLFLLRSAAGHIPPGSWSASVDGATGRQLVTFTPDEPYDNHTLYVLTIAAGAGGVRDTAGRPLVADGLVGSNFETADTIGPEIIGTTPALTRPLAQPGVLRLDFNETIVASDEVLVGAVELQWEQKDTAGIYQWQPHPVAAVLTSQGYSLSVTPTQGLVLTGDTLRRRLLVTGLADASGNAMAPLVEPISFRVRDTHAPSITLPYEHFAPSGRLSHGQSYVLEPVFDPETLDCITEAPPLCDVDRVEYYLVDPETPSAEPGYVSLAHPYSFAFVASYAGNGVDPRPFPIWVRAVDTSENAGETVELPLVVLNNQPPTIAGVEAAAVAPVAGTAYAGSTIRATVTGVADADGHQITVSAELWRLDPRARLAATAGVLVERPGSGNWTDLAPPVFDIAVPIDLAEGTALLVVAHGIDSQGSPVTVESDDFAVADDLAAPVVDGIVARRTWPLPAEATPTVFIIGDRLYLEFAARDAETAVQSVSVAVDRPDIFPQPLVATRVAGSATLFHTAAITVPADTFTEETTVAVLVAAGDYGGNTTQSTLELRVAPAADRDAPVVEWITPWEGAAWPAGYGSLVNPGEGVALLLRARASDTIDDGAGGSLPGAIARVEFRAPVSDGQGGLAPGPWIEVGEAEVDGDASAGLYESIVHVPDGIAPGTTLAFDVRVIDTGNVSTTATARLTARIARRVFERIEVAVLPADPMSAPGGDPNGPVFLLDGATVSVFPPDDGQPRLLSSLYLYAGGEVTAPATVHASMLTSPSASSYSSTTLYYPLSLHIDEALGLGAACAVDVSERGLLGNTSVQAVALPGEVPSDLDAGGSHGGKGWFGSPGGVGGWEREDLAPSGSVYDSLRDPHLPGSGGSSESPGDAGGRGGGVVRLLADTASVRLEGEIRADGGISWRGGGAGGAVLVRARRIDGAGRISASGGDAMSGGRCGGGGGGRVALYSRELGQDVDLAARVVAMGGANSTDPGLVSRLGGAGTIYFEQLHPETGAATGIGRLLIGNGSGHPAAITPLPALGVGALEEVDSAARTLTVEAPDALGDVTGDWLVATDQTGVELAVLRITSQSVVDQQQGSPRRLLLGVGADEQQLAALRAGPPITVHGRTRVAALEGNGAARIVANDELAIGDAAEASPPLDDRSRLILTGGARALLRGEGPSMSLAAVPPSGSDVHASSTVEVHWTMTDPIGLGSLSESWSLTQDTTTALVEPTSLDNSGAPRRLEIGAAAAGPVRFAVTATDIAGRSISAEMHWTVLPDALPAGTLALGPGTGLPLIAGFGAVVVVHAEDAECLASVQLVVTGPAQQPEILRPASGQRADVSFVVAPLPTASGEQPLVLRAVITDSAGATFTTEPLELPVAPNTPPSATLTLAPDTQAAVLPGSTVGVVVDAADAEGLSELTLHVIGPAGPQTRTVPLSGPSVNLQLNVAVDLLAQAGETVSIRAEVRDLNGPASAWSNTLQLGVLADTEPPTVQLTVAPQSEGDLYTAGDVVTITATAVDNVAPPTLFVTIDGATLAAGSSPLVHTWTAPPVTATTRFAVEVRANDATGNQTVVTRMLLVQPLFNPAAPVVGITCPGPGAILPFSYNGLVVGATATDDTGVALVEFFLGDASDPFASVAPPSGTPQRFDASALAPPLPAPGGATEVLLRARARDAANNLAEAFVVVQLVEAVTLDPGGANDWASLADRIAVLRTGTLTLDQPRQLGGLLVLRGASITHAASTPGTPRAVNITTPGPLYVECGGSIDVTGRGYAPDVTYPGASGPVGTVGGSHAGIGGVWGGAAGSTYGSVYRPREAGGGGREGNPTSGGGVVSLGVGGSLVVDGAIRANGGDASWGGSGAGGSAWIEAASVSGGGVIEARGGDAGSHAGGGGGSIAVVADAIGEGLLARLTARGGTSSQDVTRARAGAGTIYVKRSPSVDGELVVDNGGVDGQGTELPSLGSGVAQAGSGGAELVTDRAVAIPAYFVGHWVEVSDAQGALEGAWRVAVVSDRTVTLEANGESGEPDVGEGDRWQGVYRFDTVRVEGNGKLSSVDPIRVRDVTLAGGVAGDGTVWATPLTVEGTLEVSGTVLAREIRAHDLVVRAGAKLSHPSTVSASAPERLTIDVAGDLTIEAGGSIDVTGRGYGAGVTYPGEVLPGASSGGSHLGYGGLGSAPVGSTYGSVSRPQQAGGGGRPGWGSTAGGGVVRAVVGGSLVVDGAIRANGWDSGNSNEQGAGGSVWLTAGVVSGGGVIEARGGEGGGYRAGGGGAVAVEHGSGSVVPAIVVRGGQDPSGGQMPDKGGSGTVYLRGPSSTHGDLVVDNGGIDGQKTEMPSLGGGVVQAGSSGGVLVTDRAVAIPAYFVGHWVEVSDAQGAFKGTWRVGAISDRTVSLEANGESGEPEVAEGDRWQGVYRFDTVTVKGKAKLDCRDGARVGSVVLEAGSQLPWFDSTPPAIDAAKMSISAHGGAFWVSGTSGAVLDPGGVAEAKVRNRRTGEAVVVSVASGGGFGPVAMPGLGGDEIELAATSAHNRPATVTVPIGLLPENQASPAVSAGLVELLLDASGQRRVAGRIGAVADAEAPITIVVRNLASGIDATTIAASDGSFLVPFAGAGGDTIVLIASDGHPQPRTTTLDLGAIPGNAAPQIDTARITVTYEAEADRGEWIEPAGYVLHFAPGALDDADWPLELAIPYPDGSDSWTWTAHGGEDFDWRLLGTDLVSGMVLALTATDSHPAEPRATTVSIGPLPAGNAPPVVDPYWITLLPMGLGFHVMGAADAVRDPDGPMTIVLSNPRTAWASSAIPIAGDGSFYGRIEGAAGDEVFIQATDSHAELPLASDLVSLGTLPDTGVATTEVALDGHTVTGLRSDYTILDGGAAVAWPVLRWRQHDTDDETIGVPLADLVGAADVVWDERGERPLVLAGSDLVAFACNGSGDCPTQAPGRLTVTSGAALVRGLAHSGYLFLASEGAATELHVLPPPYIDGEGAVAPACSGAAATVVLPVATGAHVLEVFPGYAGEVAVATDQPGAEVIVVDATDPSAPTIARTLDLAGSDLPTWGVWKGGELLLGRAGGSIELWRWAGGTLTQWAAWQAAGSEVRGAARMADQLWVGLADGRLQQVDLSDPTQPRLVGEMDLGAPIVAVSDLGSSLLVATESSLVHVWVWVMPPEINPDAVAWGYQAEQTWARVEVTSAEYVDTIVASFGGREVEGSGGSFLFVVDEEVASPPTLRALDEHGVPGGPFTPTDWQTWGDWLATASEWFPEGGGLAPATCGAGLATAGVAWTPDGDAPWVATATSGAAQVEVTFSPAGAFVGASPPETRSLAAIGPVADVVSLGETLVVLDGGVGVWDMTDPAVPVLLSHTELFGVDPVAAARLASSSWPPLLVAASSSPLRLVAIDTSDARLPQIGDEAVFATVTGSVVDVARVRMREVAVLLDDGGAARLLRADIADPQAPVLLADVVLPPGLPVEAVATYCEETETGCGAGSFVAVLRTGWGVEVYALADLSPLHGVPLDGAPRGLEVARDCAGGVNLLVALGFGHGVASITGLPGAPVVAEQHTPGDSAGFAQHDPDRSGLRDLSVTSTTGIVQLTLPCRMEN